ncbi:right-handed parallel beta-helix repeat-containing protein [Sorangium atrum]|uniref:Right-handed parallel beta-helix repeat-containing protein n=1 Tax=Sorangium atrum TaxID=2995308 RepID=A0ABT5BQG0_9BACT|nr:right-handed parallel beta-helix repeat-containing protein [Sorangium aterium]MDC0676393.1 right-handed parallel beta-helix repeat-containing protein [Sorangium aterium]
MRFCATRAGSSCLAASIAALLSVVSACSDPSQSSGAPLGCEGVAPRTPSCAPGHVLGPADACMPVGIQGCAELFVEDDGLCHPSMAKCPAGTIPKFDEGCIPAGIPRCAPELAGDDGLCRPAMARCPTGTFATPEAGCVPVDGPAGCGRGPWGSVARVSGNVYVDPSYSGADGDGSEARPVTTIEAALGLVADGGTIALGEGTYDEPVVVTKPLEIVGRCASRVRIRGVSSTARPPAIVAVLDAGEVTLRGIEIGGDGAGVVATGASAVTLERVHIKDAMHAGVLSGDGARVSVAQSWIEGTRDGGAWAGIGAFADAGGALLVKESAVTGNRAAGVAALQAGATASVVGSLVEGTVSTGRYPADGQGIVVQDGAEASIESTAVVGNQLSGILVAASSSATLSGVLVEGTSPGSSDPPYGVGVYATRRARVAIDSSVVLGNTEIGVAVIGEGTAATMTRSLVQGTVAAPTGSLLGGFGVAVARGAAMRLHDSAVVRNRGTGVHVGDSSAELIASGNLIEGTVADGGWGDGAGLTVAEGRVTLASNAIRSNEGTGLLVGYDGSEATVTGNLVEGHVAPDRRAPVGQGIVIHRGATAVLEGNVVSGNRSVGVFAGTEVLGSRVEIIGNLIDGTAGRGSGEDDDEAHNDSTGIGVAAAGYEIRLASSLVRGSRTAGVVLFASEAEISQTVVDGVTGDPRAARGRRRDELVADGVLALAGSTVALDDVRVEGCARAGILYDRSSGRLSRVRALDNRFGLIVQGSPEPELKRDDDDDDKESAFLDDCTAEELSGSELRVPASAPPLP